jgi:hypothetical protein
MADVPHELSTVQETLKESSLLAQELRVQTVARHEQLVIDLEVRASERLFPRCAGSLSSTPACRSSVQVCGRPSSVHRRGDAW